jgi:hypothetical protein
MVPLGNETTGDLEDYVPFSFGELLPREEKCVRRPIVIARIGAS